MLTGFADTCKSVLVHKFLSKLNENDCIYRATSFNYYTTSASLQEFLENAFETKAGRIYATPGQKLQSQRAFPSESNLFPLQLQCLQFK